MGSFFAALSLTDKLHYWQEMTREAEKKKGQREREREREREKEREKEKDKREQEQFRAARVVARATTCSTKLCARTPVINNIRTRGGSTSERDRESGDAPSCLPRDSQAENQFA